MVCGYKLSLLWALPILMTIPTNANGQEEMTSQYPDQMEGKWFGLPTTFILKLFLLCQSFGAKDTMALNLISWFLKISQGSISQKNKNKTSQESSQNKHKIVIVGLTIRKIILAPSNIGNNLKLSAINWMHFMFD